MRRFRLEFHEGCTCQACLDLVIDRQGNKVAAGMHTPCTRCGKRECGHSLNRSAICTNSNAITQLEKSKTSILKFAA